METHKRRAASYNQKVQVKHDYTSNLYLVFSDIDIEFIKDNYLSKDDNVIGQALHRTGRSIRAKRTNLGLFKYQNKDLKGELRRIIEDNSVEEEIKALVNFIETTTSDVWREIANTRRLFLLQKTET